MRQITSQDVRRLVRKVEWVSGTTYEMYRHDYSVYNRTPVNEATSLYQSNYYVINDDLRVYICLQNGTDPENPAGKPSYDVPNFIDLEPRAAGTSGDGYIWKYLFTIKPSEIVNSILLNIFQFLKIGVVPLKLHLLRIMQLMVK